MEKELFRSKEGKKVTLVGFWVNVFLTVIKISAGIIGRSGAMLADGIHSLSDFMTDLVVLVGLKMTEKPEDDCHNYGHEKYETLATVVISMFLLFVGFEILKSGIGNIMFVVKGGILPKPGIIALVAAVISILSKEILYHYTVKVGRRINSSSVIANAWHHRSDALSSVGTFVGIGGAIALGNKWTVLDPIASIVVSILIFKVAIDILKPSLSELVEASLSDEEKEQIADILNNTFGVNSYHKLRTRRIGTKIAIEVHILVDDSLDIKSAHDIASKIEVDIKKVCGESCFVTIHIEPLSSKI